VLGVGSAVEQTPKIRVNQKFVLIRGHRSWRQQILNFELLILNCREAAQLCNPHHPHLNAPILNLEF
jgi:hypothetical protein